MRWALALAVMAAPALAAGGGDAADPMRQALEQAIDSAKREVDAPPPAPEPCFGGDGPRVRAVAQRGGLTARVPADQPWLAQEDWLMFGFSYPQMQAAEPMEGALRLRVAPAPDADLWQERLMRMMLPDMLPEDQGRLLPDGRLDLSAGMSLLRGPDGQVLVVFACQEGACKATWDVRGLRVAAMFDAGVLRDWDAVRLRSEGFLRCAFPRATGGAAVRVD